MTGKSRLEGCWLLDDVQEELLRNDLRHYWISFKFYKSVYRIV